MYVVKIDIEKNRVVLGEDLYRDTLKADRLNWISVADIEGTIEADVKIRYLAKPARAKIIKTKPDEVQVVFEEKQRAITPGQSVVFYNDDVVIGGGIICE